MDTFIQLGPIEVDDATVSSQAQDLLERHQKYLGQLDVIGTFFDIISLVKALPAFINLKSVVIYSANNPGDAPNLECLEAVSLAIGKS